MKNVLTKPPHQKKSRGNQTGKIGLCPSAGKLPSDFGRIDIPYTFRRGEEGENFGCPPTPDNFPHPFDVPGLNKTPDF